MRVPVEWLGEYVDLKGVTDTELSEALNLSGTESEIITGMKDFPGIVVGEILEIEKHPNADKLQITKTKVGKETLQIVCGAPNIEVGQKVPVALVGAEIGEFEIKEAEIRGVKSFGMLCSESELGISDDHSGIMILDPRAKVGDPLEKALGVGGSVIEAEITPNRADCFSVIGIAREAAASLNKKVKGLNFNKAETESKKTIKVEVKEENLCPRYIAKFVEGVKIGPSPKWMQDRLSAAGVRPINNVVDVTNYVMLEWGQPMHAFDAKKVADKIVVRKAKEGEKLETLDGVERKLTANDLVIADPKKPIAVAGVMGGANSEVNEKTTKIILEAAVFDGTSVRKTAQRQGIRTEASNRFEKGIPLGLPEIAIERAAQLIIESGGAKAGTSTDVLSKWIWLRHVGVRVSKMKKFLGADIPTEKVIEILKSLGFEAERFDFKKEARKHVGKPYIFGARFKTHGDMAFDCSYLTDYIYSLIGQFVGYTSLAQFELGEPIEVEDLKPGDILFVKGHIDKSVTDSYFVPDGKGGYEKVKLEKPKEVGHNALYIGNGRIIHAHHYEYDSKTNKWTKAKEGKVVEEDLEVFTKNPEYLGARRYVEDAEDWIAVDVPWWRLDVAIEEDVFEEIGRIYGYNNFPTTLPTGPLPKFELNKKGTLSAKLKQVLVGAGFNEVYNYSFVSEKMLAATGADAKKAFEIKNPLSPEQKYMRTNLACSLLADVRVNQDNFESFKIFEVASIYEPTGKELPKETQTLGLLAKSNQKGAAAFFDLKGAIEFVAERLNIGKPTFKKEEVYLDKSQTAGIYLDGKKIGYLGMTNPKTEASFGLKTSMAVAEINLELVLEKETSEIKYQTISRFPESVRDINLVFENKVPAAEIQEALEKKIGGNLKKFLILDIYQGQGLAENNKSVTIRLVFGSGERTLTENEISVGVAEVSNLLKKKFSAKERI